IIGDTMQFGRTTLSKFVIENTRASHGELGALLIDVAAAVKTISAMVAKGALGGNHGALDSTNIQGEVQKKLDVLTNEAILRHCEWGGQLAGMASEEMDEPYPIPAEYPRGRYVLIFDPLDGSSNSDVNVSVGTIFSIFTRLAAGDAEAADYLRPGCEQVAAGYAIYTSNERFWEPPVQRYVAECKAGKSGVRGVDFNTRWIASMVAEVHRILIRGGIFMYPKDSKDPSKPGRLRLMYEANPMAMLIEQAGGSATTGRQRILDVAPDSLHQRVPVILGSKNEVERLERYHHEYDTGADRPFVSPLFSERSLFRDESRV